MSESDDINEFREFLKRVNAYEFPSPEENVFGPPEPGVYRMCECYINFVWKVSPDLEYNFNPETGLFDYYHKSDPFKVDMRKLIDAAYDVYVERIKAKSEAAKEAS